MYYPRLHEENIRQTIATNPVTAFICPGNAGNPPWRQTATGLSNNPLPLPGKPIGNGKARRCRMVFRVDTLLPHLHRRDTSET